MKVCLSEELFVFLLYYEISQTKILETVTSKTHGKGSDCFVYYTNNFIMRILCKWLVCPWVNSIPDNKDEIKHTSNIRKVSIGTVDLLHVTGIKGDKIMEIFSRLNSASSIELIWMIWMNNSRNCPGKATNPIQTTRYRATVGRLSISWKFIW